MLGGILIKCEPGRERVVRSESEVEDVLGGI